MTNREMKKMIREAYHVEPLDRKFAAKYQKREMNMFDLLWQQAEHIGKLNAIIAVIIIAAFIMYIQVEEVEDPYTLARVSAMIPVIGVVALAGVNRSEKYGMDELEMSTRFSLRTVKLARLVVVGIVDVVVLGIAAAAIDIQGQIGPAQAVMLVMLPYLATAWGCLAITRKIHSRRDIYACWGWAACIAFICGVSDEEVAWSSVITGGTGTLVIFAGLIVLIGIEISRMIKGENIEWNLC